MIKEMLKTIENIFVKEMGLKVFLVTHSPSTIALSENNCIFVMRKKDETGKRFEKVDKNRALDVLTEGFATISSGLELIDATAHHELSIFSEGNNIQYLEKAVSIFMNENEAKKINLVANLEDKTSKSNLCHYFDLFVRISHSRPVLFIFDSDVTKTLTDKNATYHYILKKNKENNKVVSGIENMFKEDFFDSRFYSSSQKKDGGIYTKLDKCKFVTHMIKNGTKEDFENFEPLIKKIRDILILNSS